VEPSTHSSGASSADKLIRMANQIATFFRSYPDDEASAGIHDHIVAFWTPRMRSTLVALSQADPARLDRLVIKAMGHFTAAESPIEKTTAGPAEIGQLGSDAG
jgi:formate dehydrogenase subunit delta